MKKSKLVIMLFLISAPVLVLGFYRATITNKCPNRIWYRIYTGQGYFLGKDIGPGKTQFAKKQNGFINIQGLLWKLGSKSNWEPTFKGKLEKKASKSNIVISPIFGPRPARTIKILLVCLAGPADPAVRNDTVLIDKFIKAGVPRENIWMLLEKQSTPKTISAALKNIVSKNVLAPDDILFIYLGGHGTAKGQYYLATWEGFTPSSLVLSEIEKTSAQVFMVIDSCYSGNMILDAKKWFKRKRKPRLSILTSVQANKTAYTGWRLISLLIENITKGTYVSPQSIGKNIVKKLRTSASYQRAQYFDFENN